jgi:hypothetical protein
MELENAILRLRIVDGNRALSVTKLREIIFYFQQIALKGLFFYLKKF